MDTISDMLFYLENGEIKIFPAVSKSWKNIEFKDFRGYEGISVSANLKDGELKYIKNKASSDCKVKILNNLTCFDTSINVNENNIVDLKEGQIIELSRS